MHFEFGLRSSLLLIFFTHLLVYTWLFFRRGIINHQLPDKLLGSFLFLAALFIFPWMSGFAGWYDNQPYRDILFYTPFIQALFFGPLLYLYLKSITNNSFRLQKKDLFHFIPGVMYLCWSGVVYITDKWIVGDYYLMNGHTDPDFDSWYSYCWAISILIYLILSIRYYIRYLLFTNYEFSFADEASLKWLRNFLYVFSLITLLLISERLVSVFISLHYVQEWYYFFAFALITYYIAISAYSAPQRTLLKLNFEPALLMEYQEPLSIDHLQHNTIGDLPSASVEEDILMPIIKEKVIEIMANERVFLEPELTLTELAKKLHTNASTLSKVINTCFGISFNDYINQYRVNEAIRLMSDVRYKNLNLLSIAYDAGFNSKSTFNRAFKKVTGQIPSVYLKELLP